MARRPATASPAFTLIEMAIVLVIAGIIAVMLLGASSAFLDNEKRKNVRARLDAVEVALVNFVAVNKRLPCPANGTKQSNAGAGLEVLSAPGVCDVTVAADGVLPWVALGLTEIEASDPWNARLTYRVDPALTQALPKPLLMNMSNCDPSSTGPAGAGGICSAPVLPCTGTTGCTSPTNFLAGKGLDVWDGQNGTTGWLARQNNSTAGTGAAWVVISHGPSGAGAYNAQGKLQPGTVDLGKDLEDKNVNGLALAKPATQANAYRDAPLNDNEVQYVPVPPAPPPVPPLALLHFDDYLSHPTLMAVLVRANLGPRAH
jgi:prepilin-type N-terminal cleavage/methylation domain-containing protein